LAAPVRGAGRSAQLAFLLGCLAVLGPAQAPAVADESPVAIEDIRIGIEGAYKRGQWTPIHVRIKTGHEGFRGRLTVQAADPSGVAAQHIGQEFEIAPDSTESLTTYVKLGQMESDLRVMLDSADGRDVRRRLSPVQMPPALSTEQQLVLTLGHELSLARARTLRQGTEVERVVERSVTTPGDLPRHWLGYASVDMVVLTSSDVTALTQIDAEQWSALRRWVELGGTLIACGAQQAEDLFGPDGALAWVLPGRLQGIVQQRQTAGLEQFAGATRRLDQGGGGGRAFSLPMALVRAPRGRVEASEGFGAQQAAAIIRSSLGLGRVVFVAFDLDRPPFTAWPDLPRLLARLLDLALDEAGEADAMRSGLGPVTHVGYADLVGQLRHALDQFAGVRLVPFSWIAGLVAVYILLIGPLDYWLLRRWRRSAWTWLTFGLSVVVFTGVAMVLASWWKGHEFRSNQVTLIDMDLSRGIVRGTTWAHVFSPRTSQVEFQTRALAEFNWITPPQQVTTWHGLPGDGFGGLDRYDSTETFKVPYRVHLKLVPPADADVRLEDFPLAVWSSQSLLGQWWGEAELSPDATQLKADAESTVSGTLTSPLPVTIEDAYLIYDRWAIRLGEVSPGERIAINGSGGVDLQTLLTRRRIVDGRNVVVPWSHDSTDVERIMQLLMFYGAAKGRTYTRLQHRYQRTVDWSDHVTAHQAVLWGRSRTPGADLLLNGQPVFQRQDWTYYRLLIPVSLPGEA
jgi:hypothetical protein